MSSDELSATADIPWPSQLRFLEETRPTAAENLAHDEALLDQHDASPDLATLWIWEMTAPAVIVGRSNQIEREVNVAACEADGIPILRRCSGGGAVVLGRGCLCYSLFLPVTEVHRHQGISAVTASIMQRLATGLSRPDQTVVVRGVSDLVLDGRKFSGNSQRWRRKALLHHGTVLYDFDLEAVGRYLQFPSRVPDYRADRNHLEFVRNIDLSRDDIIERLRTTWHA